MAARSTHKRKRSAQRADRARARPGGRATIRYVHDADVSRDVAPLVEAHPFYHQLDVVLPSAAHDAAASCAALVRDVGAAFYCLTMSLSLLLEPSFVATYIRSGSLFMLSTTHLDAEDTICLDGRGMLILSLSRDTYQQLGLVGRPAQFARGASGRMGDRRSGPVSRYLVELPLLDPSFVPGKRGYERAKQCVAAWDAARAGAHAAARPAPTWQVLAVWTPPAPPSGEAPWCAPVSWPPAWVTQVRTLPIEAHVHTVPDVWVPDAMAADSSESAWDLAEWAAMVTLRSPRLQTYDACEPLVAVYRPPWPHAPGTCQHVQLRGLLPPALVTHLIHTLQRGLAPPRAPWACVTAAGFQDTPLAWRSKFPGLGLALGSGPSVDAPSDGLTATQRAKKVRRKGHTRRGASEHGFVQSGENGWSLLCAASSPNNMRLTWITSVEQDTHL